MLVTATEYTRMVLLAKNTRVSSMNERHWYRQECKVATAVYLYFTLWCIMVHSRGRRDLSLVSHVLSKIYRYNNCNLISKWLGEIFDKHSFEVQTRWVLVIDRKLRLLKLP